MNAGPSASRIETLSSRSWDRLTPCFEKRSASCDPESSELSGLMEVRFADWMACCPAWTVASSSATTDARALPRPVGIETDPLESVKTGSEPPIALYFHETEQANPKTVLRIIGRVVGNVPPARTIRTGAWIVAEAGCPE